MRHQRLPSRWSWASSPGHTLARVLALPTPFGTAKEVMTRSTRAQPKRFTEHLPTVEAVSFSRRHITDLGPVSVSLTTESPTHGQ